LHRPNVDVEVLLDRGQRDIERSEVVAMTKTPRPIAKRAMLVPRCCMESPLR